MMYQNKWNSGLYEVVEYVGKQVVLKRTDGSTFEIPVAEFNFSYRKVEKN